MKLEKDVKKRFDKKFYVVVKTTPKNKIKKHYEYIFEKEEVQDFLAQEIQTAVQKERRINNVRAEIDGLSGFLEGVTSCKDYTEENLEKRVREVKRLLSENKILLKALTTKDTKDV